VSSFKIVSGDAVHQVIKLKQLLAHGRCFSPGTSASSTTKTGHHDIVEILLKVALNTNIQIKSYVLQPFEKNGMLSHMERMCV
jgi:hypothetical protein